MLTWLQISKALLTRVSLHINVLFNMQWMLLMIMVLTMWLWWWTHFVRISVYRQATAANILQDDMKLDFVHVRRKHLSQYVPAHFLRKKVNSCLHVIYANSMLIIPRHEVEGGYRFRCHSVIPSFRPSVPKSFPEHNSETISYFQTKLDIFIDQDLNWCLLLFIDVWFYSFCRFHGNNM